MNFSNLASRLDNIAPFHVMELAKMAAALERQGRHIIHMGIGEPDFTAPPLVVEAATAAMRAGNMQYTSATGLPAALWDERLSSAAVNRFLRVPYPAG